jgi:hypothetical protein
MLKLYRGIIDILTERSEGLTIAFRNHIREFNDGETVENNFGVKGFWNLLLEIVFVMYVKLFVAFGVMLSVGLSLVFFPLHAIRVACVNIMNHRAEPFPVQDYQEPILEKKNGNTKKEK